MSIEKFITDIKSFIPNDRIYKDDLRRYAYGTDASCYRLIPQVVVRVKGEADIILCINTASKYNVAITFRAAGTSLAGQAITDSVLILIDNQWNKFKIFDHGDKISLEPGVVGEHANIYLKPYKRKIGPDPASIRAAKIGGIAANNASGMCCGVNYNSYHTLDSMQIVFSNGHTLNTASNSSRNQFIKNNPDFIKSISSLSDKIKSNNMLAERIRHKYRIKNTTGYGLNSLLDFNDPIDIIQHLLIGSEGTLGFISNITYNTLPDLKLKSCALVFFETMRNACDFIETCKTLPITAVEMMDSISLKTMKGKAGTPKALNYINDQSAALLLEVESEDQNTLEEYIQQVSSTLEKTRLMPKSSITFSKTREVHKCLWDLREGIFTAIGGQREIGSSAIIEDVAVETHKLADLCHDLQKLFNKHGYLNGAIYGHALAGNVHFVFTPRFDSEKEIKKFSDFLTDVVNTVVEKYDGSIKAEHGTGRNMAPFVETEWGDDIYQIQKQIKALFDPKNILNPGVIINDDPDIHTKNLKELPQADDLVDHCIECGFCEHVCPSRNLSLTPRQRITVYREISKLSQSDLNSNEKNRLNSLKKDYQYLAIDTCAATGLCQLECPVSINTGDLMLKFRENKNSMISKKIASFIANHFDSFLAISRMGLTINKFISKALGSKIMKIIYTVISPVIKIKLQSVTKYMPGSAKKLNHQERK